MLFFLHHGRAFIGNTSWNEAEHSSTIPENVRRVISYTQLTFNGTLVLQVLFWCSTRKPQQFGAPDVTTNTGNSFKQSEEVTTVIRLWRSRNSQNIQLSINGKDHLPFVFSPTVYHTMLQLPCEKAIYKQRNLTICTVLIKVSSGLKKKKR